MPNLRAAPSPNGKLNHAAVGVDGQGWSDLSNIASHDHVNVAVSIAAMERGKHVYCEKPLAH